MNSNSLVSVVVPIYNIASYLEETLNSVLASSYSTLEIILMDDDSRYDAAVSAQ